MTAVYFTVTTITTVGYGDMSASTFLEQIFCVIIMIIGVIAFSMASGALTNYISK
jgi:voltage-gated potassium channel Kch